MVELDFRTQTPGDWTGKSVTIHEATYLVGPLIRTGSKYHVFPLTNARSRLTLHVLKVRKNFAADPVTSRAESVVTVHDGALLDATFRANGGPFVVIPVAFVVDGHGGSFEVHANVDPDLGPEDPERTSLTAANACASAGDHASALNALRAIVARAPNHTQALYDLANVLCDVGEQEKAFSVLTTAIEIEPHVIEYRWLQVGAAWRSGNAAIAADRFLALRERFPAFHREDEKGVKLLLNDGRPDAAVPFLEQLPLGRRDEVRGWVVAAQEARAAARAKLAAATAIVDEGRPDWPLILEITTAAWQIYPLDVEVSINHAFALQSAGRWVEAGDLLLSGRDKAPHFLYPWRFINSLACAVEASDWHRVAVLAGLLHSILKRMQPAQEALARPGLGVWFDGHFMHQRGPESVLAVIEQAITSAPEPREQLEALLRWYRGGESR